MVWTDNALGFDEDVPAVRPANLGSADNPLGKIYAQQITGAIVGQDTLANNTPLLSLKADGVTTTGLIRNDAFDKTVLMTPTGAQFAFEYGGSINGYISATGSVLPVSINTAAFNLLDNSDKNHALSSFASGTAYTLTAVAANTHFGTSDAQLTIDKAGTYLILSKINIEYVGATFASNRTVTLTLQRTNNTPAALTGATTAFGTNVVTTVSGILYNGQVAPVLYTTTNTNDIIQIYSSVSVLPTAGSIQATEANLVAIRLY